MAAAISGIWNPSTQASATSATGVHAMDTSTSDTDSSGATISANDFLTLLVTEMQNQDPTATTDPNEYINQLVNVNSLEQLISINQTLQDAAGTTSDSTTAGGVQAASTSATSTPQIALHAKASAAAASSAASAAAATTSSASTTTSHAAVAHGNLSAPAASRSALRVAHALDAPRITR